MSQPASRVRLPLGIQTFSEIRRENLYYVDKTHFACQLFRRGKHYFLSRPRRFGKSLFVSTLQELFEGRRELFRGLAADDQWDWSVRRPVAHLSFGGGLHTQPGGLQHNLLHGRRAVVLVDEYDKPIVDALRKPDLAADNRDCLRALYSNLKECDAHLRFSFLTGVSKFSKVSLFCGVNNLIDLTMEASFSSICGYTDHDLDTVFAPELPGLDRRKIREWYNGCSWGGEEKIYNSYDVLLPLRHPSAVRQAQVPDGLPQTGAPKFRPDLLARRNCSTLDIEGLPADESLLSAFDIDELATEALLFQTDRRTLADWSGDGDGFPGGKAPAGRCGS